MTIGQPYAQSRIQPTGRPDVRKDAFWNGVPWDERVSRTVYVAKGGEWVLHTARQVKGRSVSVPSVASVSMPKPRVALCDRSMLPVARCRCDTCA